MRIPTYPHVYTMASVHYGPRTVPPHLSNHISPNHVWCMPYPCLVHALPMYGLSAVDLTLYEPLEEELLAHPRRCLACHATINPMGLDAHAKQCQAFKFFQDRMKLDRMKHPAVQRIRGR